eukprot:COSAG06_NODE_412_length_16042_cov_52.419934_16_plen_107_part_00
MYNHVLLGDGQGGFTTVSMATISGEHPSSSTGAASCDFNKDGAADIVVANAGAEDEITGLHPFNEVLMSDGQGGFSSTLLERSYYSFGERAENAASVIELVFQASC